jgi:hypothetical protein
MSYGITTALTTVLTYFKAGLGRVVWFMTSGWQSYVGMFMFVVLDHWETLTSGDLVQFMFDIGVKLGRADRIMAANIEAILRGVEGLMYLQSVLEILISLFTILWFLRTVGFLIYVSEGSNVSPKFRWGISVLIWVLAVITVEKRLPLAVLDLIMNFEELFSWSRLNPFTETNASVENMTVYSNYTLDYLQNTTG